MQQTIRSGTLYVVGTPIGNLGDLSPRAAEVLGAVDFIAAEDTRVSLKLLNHFGIKKTLVSYHEHNKKERGAEIVARLLSGEACAIVTDAGMPCISDPGEDLVRLCRENGVEVQAVPGPSAVISALAVSGLVTSRFMFEGFLSVNRKNRYEHLESIKEDTHTLIFYEAPHKLRTTLEDLLKILGDRKISISRELTKLHEQTVCTTLSESILCYQETPPKGEFVLVVEGAKPKPAEQMALADAVQLVHRHIEAGDSVSEAARQVAKETGFRKGELYKAALQD
ncbi:16S rRNA (cytidine(1402)-2'-O)-methyltransferase [Candidatus Soleaferrea massiliensis]|uniref:16S rRNA (cytidine(1402)-2'-O)-methyltransferase n=1 Tax=Candidatus Soleaferrea massiliensis TaxID=1470354 RepID=UPI00058E1BF2|nr:16S rRNA (cytidine(1402)-2'-O)-methyltransferase [Candidatus Soleaferrea massiliensis]